MKKRILCAILTLVLLVSLVPMGALTASAATYSVSERAITILKQLQSYTSECNEKGYTGYGTKCTKSGTHGNHKISETIADEALRDALKDVDKAVNSFASSNGLSLRQNQHDALVLFSFRNGTAWMSGTGDVKAAVTTGATGNEFLNMFCNWRSNDYDNTRRLIEANMYLNGAYSSSVPSRYIKVTFDPNGGTLPGNKTVFYFDVNASDTALPTPTKAGRTFIGWYNMAGQADDAKPTNWVHKLTSICNNLTLTAYWQRDDKTGDLDLATAADYILPSSLLASKYVYADPFEDREDSTVSGNLHVFEEFIDSKGVKWAHIDSAESYTYKDSDGKTQTVKNYARKSWWVKIGKISSTTNTSSGSDESGIDVVVTVTNTYVNARDKASIYGGLKGTYTQGTKLRIVGKPVSASGFLWGQVAKSSTDATPVAWIALMYTDYESVIAAADTSEPAESTTVVAKAHITAPVNGYVNVRNGAGVNNTIVGSVSYGTMVDIYEIQYVNGHQWGRCSQGWFLLSYADVTRLTEEKNETSQLGFTAYAFKGKIRNVKEIYSEPNGETVYLDRVEEEVGQTIVNDQIVTVTNLLKLDDGSTWGKIAHGWICLDSNFYGMAQAKFQVTAETATVRSGPSTSASRVDTLSKGVEFSVKSIGDIFVDNDSATIWGKAQKIGETNTEGTGDTYIGWVNLSSAYVKRVNAVITAQTTESSSSSTGLVATVINVDMVNVRSKASVYGTLVCKIPMGTTAEVLEEEDGWYRLKLNGREDMETWVYGQYLSVSSASSTGTGSSGTGSTSGSVETGKGIIANTYAGVNVRQTPGIGGAFVGKILPGTVVEILEVKQVGASKWGRVEQGWICMDYVTMLTYEEIPGASGNTGSNGTTGATGGSSSSVTAAQPAIYTGTVAALSNSGVNAAALDPETPYGDVDDNGRDEQGSLIIFQDTDINSAHVRKLNNGEKVTIHEILTAEEQIVSETDDNQGTTVVTKTAYWARVNDGYVRSPGNNLELDTLNEEVYTLVASDKLKAYDAPLSDNTVFTLVKGEQVHVTRVKILRNTVYGLVEYEDEDGLVEGWIDLSRMVKGAISVQTESVPEETTGSTTSEPVVGSTGNTGSTGYVSNAGGYKYTGKVINTNEVNVRASASTSAAVTAVLKGGASLVIYETTIAEAMAWGRCDAGWVYLYYVDLTPASGSAIDAKVVYNDNTIAYTDTSCTQAAGTYSRMAVVDIYEEVGNMVRTELGWVNKDNLLN